MNAIAITIIICLTILAFTGTIVAAVYFNSKAKYSAKIAAKASLDYLIAEISDIERGKSSAATFECDNEDNKELGKVATNYYRKGWANGYVTCKNDIIKVLRYNQERTLSDIEHS